MTIDRSKYQTVLLFGAPGVGKGTQGRILGQIPGFYHLSCGDVFRSLDINSPEGREIYKYSSRGELAPDEITIRVWKRAMDAYTTLSFYKPHEDLLILDGIPRNRRQAELISDYVQVQAIVHLICSDEEAMIHRMRRRAIRENRADDADEKVIRRRFEVYHQESAPVLEFYNAECIHRIDAFGSPAEVLLKVLQCVVPVQNEHFRRQPVSSL
jgi:adenylate kinase